MNQALQKKDKKLGNLQKQLLTNYFLQKYSTLMSEMTHDDPNNYQANFHTRPKSPNKKINFKNLLQQKQIIKNTRAQNSNTGSPPRSGYHSRIDSQAVGQEQRSLSRSRKEEQLMNRTIKKVEASIVKQLFKESPTKLQSKKYDKIQIEPIAKLQQPQAEYVPLEGGSIDIYYESEREGAEEQDIFKEEDEDQKEAQAVRSAIKRQFQSRKEKPIRLKNSRHSSLSKRGLSQAKSSKISVEGKIDSPKKSAKASPTPFNKDYYQPSPHLNHQSSSIENSSSKIEQEIAMEPSRHLVHSPHVHYHTEVIEPVQPHEHQREYSDGENNVLENEIEFVAPSSNYYRSSNSNFIEEAFRFQSSSGTNNPSQRQSAEKNQALSRSLNKVSSKKSLKERDRPNSNSSGKDSSRFEGSFVSKISMISYDDGQNIKGAIEQDLFENQLGPYQSALYGVLELIQKYPRSGPVYAVGQRTLEDRRDVEEKKKSQLLEMEELNKKIQRLSRKRVVWGLGGQDQIIRNNRLSILQLVRQLASKHR